MTGQLDELSRVIGQQEANLANLNKTFGQHCLDDDRRHGENITTMREMQTTLGDLMTQVKSIAERVSVMSPIVEGVQISKWKLNGAIALASALLTGVGYLLLTGIEAVIKAALTHFK